MESFQTFLNRHTTKSYSKGQTIIGQNEFPACAFVVKYGLIKAFEITVEGEVKNIIFDTTFEIFPIGWVFGKLNSTKFFYEAFTDCELYLVPRDDLIYFLKTNPSEMYELFDFFVERYLAYQMRVLGLTQTRASDKILLSLRLLTRRFGEKKSNNQIELQIPLTQQDIADFVGLTRETTSTELKKLERQGVLKSKSKQYIVNLKAFRKALENK